MKINFHDLTKDVVYDFKTFKYKLIDLNNLDYYVKELLVDKIDVKNLNINLPTIDDLLLAQYPFINEINDDVIKKIIQRNHRINELVDYAIKHKKGEKLEFYNLDEKDKFIINLAKQYLYDLNKFIYKYEINDLYSNLVFVNNDFNNRYIGCVDVIGKSKNGWYLISLKTAKTNYLKKYYAELYLQKVLFESNTNQKIKEMFILNPRSDQYIIKYVDLTQKEKRLLIEGYFS